MRPLGQFLPATPIVLEESEANDYGSDSDDYLPSHQELLKRNTPAVKNPDQGAMRAKTTDQAKGNLGDGIKTAGAASQMTEPNTPLNSCADRTSTANNSPDPPPPGKRSASVEDGPAEQLSESRH
ncbi:hypothetical protein P152DRAFT_514187 [Eremomyces bilateralis CBS 781.70]|uniref:Uncharacterized protein n=1 Tax=Eremomyces bilateralis CBS 781.70 TaxID=1392243 RepID=A0A6G1G420_9PEZI|nr:uncharacterized protein P152DRAFT_514187 [Eremomyces bilateralis CBS 781.70]KAF1812569.1 hypothetical protein P152DRAFT_514187 [Eremomyces bilateralis CBS 781.70]